MTIPPSISTYEEKKEKRKTSKANHFSFRNEGLTPKGLRVFLLKTASKQPLLKTSQIV
jgi:hypothetical protein